MLKREKNIMYTSKLKLLIQKNNVTITISNILNSVTYC